MRVVPCALNHAIPAMQRRITSNRPPDCTEVEIRLLLDLGPSLRTQQVYARFQFLPLPFIVIVTYSLGPSDLGLG